MYLRTQIHYWITIGVIGVLALSACSDDEAGPLDSCEDISDYNANDHIYATILLDDLEEWEIIINPLTAEMDFVEGTNMQGGSLSSPVGARNLTAFSRNQRIFVDEVPKNQLVIQDLETLVYTDFELRDTSAALSPINLQFMRFGANETEVYLIDTDYSIWKVDLDNQITEKIIDRIPLEAGIYISDFFYEKNSGNFLLTTNSIAINSGTTTNLVLFDPASEEIIQEKDIQEVFGLVFHAQSNALFCLQAPNSSEGFRLMKIQTDGLTSINVSQISETDLAIDELSLYAQTIHTTSNSYVCRGGPNTIGNLVNNIYSIDLSSGLFKSSEELCKTGTILKLAGE